MKFRVCGSIFYANTYTEPIYVIESNMSSESPSSVVAVSNFHNRHSSRHVVLLVKVKLLIYSNLGVKESSSHSSLTLFLQT